MSVVASSPCSPRVHSRRYTLERPAPDDAPAIAAIMRRPMPGRMRIALHGHAHDDAPRHHAVIARDRRSGVVVGYASRTVRPMWINGEPALVGYLGSFRTLPGTRIPRGIFAEAYDTLLDTRALDELPFDLTSIMADNRGVRRVLERGMRGFPTYTPLGGLLTVTVSTRGGAAAASMPQPTGPAGPDRRAAFNAASCAPIAGAIVRVPCADGTVASAALRDRRRTRPIVVDGYAPPLAGWRPMLNIALRCAGRPTLPPAGCELPLIFLAAIQCPLQPESVTRLVRAAGTAARRRGAALLSLGLPDTEAGRRTARRLRGWISRSVIYAVHRGAAPDVDDRPLWPEVADL